MISDDAIKQNGEWLPTSPGKSSRLGQSRESESRRGGPFVISTVRGNVDFASFVNTGIIASRFCDRDQSLGHDASSSNASRARRELVINDNVKNRDQVLPRAQGDLVMADSV